MNKPLFLKIADHVYENPDSFDLNEWAIFVNDYDDWDEMIQQNYGEAEVLGREDHGCETICCVAGWACTLSGVSVRSIRKIQAQASVLLGITEKEANALFCGGWPEVFASAHTQAETVEGQAQVASDLLKEIVKYDSITEAFEALA